MKKNNHLILAIIASLLTATIFADDYKIINMNTSKVTIGSHDYVVGDVFSDDSVIVWSKDSQAIKAQNLMTKEIHLFTKPGFSKNGSKTIKEFYMKTNKLSARATGLSLSELSEQLNDTFYLLDTIRIESPIPLDSTRNYYISYKTDSIEKQQKLEDYDNYFLINREIFNERDFVNDFSVRVFFRSKYVSEDYILTDSMHIVLIPLCVDK